MALSPTPTRIAVWLALLAAAAVPVTAPAQATRPEATAQAQRPPGAGPRQQAGPGPRGPQRGKASPPAQAPAAPPEPAGPEQLQAAELVYYGRHDCEDKQVVDLERHDAHPGYVRLKLTNQQWVMKPIASHTGAVRLEDVLGQTLMVQIPFKSMLMNVKSGQRMVDSCMHEIQKAAHRDAAGAGTPAPGILSR
jgi:hypothetical protein